MTATRSPRRLADRELAIYLLRFAFLDLPVLAAGVLFWLGLGFRFKSISTGWLVALIAALALTMAGAVLLLRDRWRRLRRAYLERQVTSTVRVRSSQSADRLKGWKDAVPSRADVRAVESLCSGVAAEWASDGTVSAILYYMRQSGQSVRLIVQALAFSAIRSEMCHLDIDGDKAAPGRAQAVRESPRTFLSILAVPCWREAWLTAIEAAAWAIEDGDFVDMQMAVSPDCMSFNTHGLSDNRRHETTSVLLCDGRLVEESTGRTIRIFEAWPCRNGTDQPPIA